MVLLNHFGVEILPERDVGREFQRDGAWYYGLRHNTEYRIRLINRGSTDCDAEVRIDGDRAGSWRIDGRSDIIIERPSRIDRKFTFVSEKSWQAAEAGVDKWDFDNGLISVTFRPRLPYRERYERVGGQNYRGGSLEAQAASPPFRGDRMSAMPQALVAVAAAPPYQPGATVLGADSSQRFASISPIPEDEIDRSNVTTITIRLVVDQHTQHYTKVPQPIYY